MFRSSLHQYVQKVAAQVKSGEWEPQPIEIVYQCVTCEDLGMIRYNTNGDIHHPLFGKMFPCPDCKLGQSLTERSVTTKLNLAELPDAYRKWTLKSWEILPAEKKAGKNLAFNCTKLFLRDPKHYVSLTEAFKLCNEPIDETDDVLRNSLIFHGPPGVGKTTLAVAIAREVMDAGGSALYIRTQDFIESLKETFDREKRLGDDFNGHSMAEILNAVKRHSLLILDEFNMSKVGDWRQEQIENVIRFRYGNALPTIITCNANKGELERQWGVRTASVLFAMAHWIPMGGEVLRDDRQTEKVF